jgi:integrase
MAGITDKGMQGKAEARDKWLIESAGRGEGRLVGRITPAGTRSFYYRYTGASGERVRLLIGPYDSRGDGAAAFTVQQARDRARELSALYRSGVKDLRGHLEQQRRDREQAQAAAQRAAELERQRIEQEAAERAAAAARRITVRKLFEQWQRAELTPHILADGTRTGRKDGGEWVGQSFERRVFPALGDVAAEDIRRADLLKILDDAKAEGRRRTANVLLADLRQMFRFAVEREIVATNPLEGIKRGKIGGKDVARDRVLDDDELRALARALACKGCMSPRSTVAVWLILATAVRVGEAMGARWEHVDLEQRRWYLPQTKNQRDHTIHLSDFALAQFSALASLREVCPDGKLSPWVFPATDPTQPVCIKSFGKQLADRQRTPERRMSGRTKAVQALALPGGRWTAHDLRRTAASTMARLGLSGDVIDECLNHVIESRVRRTYIWDRRPAEQARAFDALGTHLQRLVSGKHVAAVTNVVTLPTRAA